MNQATNTSSISLEAQSGCLSTTFLQYNIPGLQFGFGEVLISLPHATSPSKIFQITPPSTPAPHKVPINKDVSQNYVPNLQYVSAPLSVLHPNLSLFPLSFPSSFPIPEAILNNPPRQVNLVRLRPTRPLCHGPHPHQRTLHLRAEDREGGKGIPAYA